MSKRPVQPPTLAAMRRNFILSVLPDSAAAQIINQGAMEQLALRQEIYEPEETIRFVYFPVDCVLSNVAQMRDGLQIEIGTIGREGASALPLLLGGTVSSTVCFCQVRGTAIKISADFFHRLSSTEPAFRHALDGYSRAYINLLGQIAACNRLHSVSERCARWLLMTHDRVESDRLALTHEFLAMLLGTRRSGVSDAAAILQAAGFIKYAHGVIDILDRRGLEGASCECYAVARDLFEGLRESAFRRERGDDGDSVQRARAS